MQNLNWYYDLVPHTHFPALQTICSVLNLRSRCFIATFPLFCLPFFLHSEIPLCYALWSWWVELWLSTWNYQLMASSIRIRWIRDTNYLVPFTSSNIEFLFLVAIYEVLIILLYHFTWLSSNLVSSAQFDCRYVAHSWLVPLWNIFASRVLLAKSVERRSKPVPRYELNLCECKYVLYNMQFSIECRK